MSGSRLFDDLVEALRVLPGVGAKSAMRMALHVLERDRERGAKLAKSLALAIERVGHCKRCRNLSEEDICNLCLSGARDGSLLCVVEGPQDLFAIEQATGFRGRYFVLHGRLSPIDGLGPNELGMPLLAERLDEGEVRELIIATNATVEGEVTAHYLSQMAATRQIRATRLAHGVPLGGELEFVDRTTLAHAFGGRMPVER